MVRTLRYAVVAVLAATLAATAVPGAARAAPPGPALVWGVCADDLPDVPLDPGVQCAMLRLPVDWSRPRGDTFELSVARRQARGPAPRVGTLVFGPGGPGDSGVERIRRNDRFSAELRDRFDIVSFDPRAVARSAPARCARRPDVPRPPVPLRNQADVDATVADNLATWDACRPTSAVFAHADTMSTVRDLDALRRALGERQLTFHGSSYGTLLGQQYAERFPHRVRAIVLESVFDHSLDVTEFVRTQAVAVQDSFDEFVTWCATAADCALRGRDVRAVWADVLARADAGGYAPATAGDIAALPIRRLAGPDRVRLARDIADLADGRPVQLGLPPLVTPVFCADWSATVPDYDAYAELIRVAAAAGPDIRYGGGIFAVHACLGWPTPVRNPPHDLRVTGGPPLLLINALHDPRTGHGWAANVAAQLGDRGRLVTYDGAGHGSYLRTPCMTAAVDRYLVDLALPAPGARCAAV